MFRTVVVFESNMADIRYSK